MCGRTVGVVSQDTIQSLVSQVFVLVNLYANNTYVYLYLIHEQKKQGTNIVIL